MVGAPLSMDDAEERRLDFERTLMEADRMMMQIVQTAMSLVGFGFTIATFFGEGAPGTGAPHGGRVATILGIALLFIGLLLITSGTWSQALYRRELRQRYADVRGGGMPWAGLMARFTPSFIAAVLLMLAAVFSLVTALIRWLL